MSTQTTSAETFAPLLRQMLRSDDPAVLSQIYAPDCIFHDGGTTYQGLQKFFEIYGPVFAGVSNMKVEMVNDPVVQGDRLAYCYTTTFTHTGELMGVPATGRQVSVYGMEIARIADSRIVERWSVVDFGGALQQLNEK